MEAETGGDNLHRSVCTDYECIHPDRGTAPRDTTPLRCVPRDANGIPSGYAHARQAEYEALIARGATRHMCTTFRLSFDRGTGIIARLRQGDTLWEEFAGPAMAASDVWMVCLGRRVVLEERDVDGSRFMEELLEEVLYYPIHGVGDGTGLDEWRWETVKEGNGWVTRPMMKVATIQDAGSDSSSDSDSEPNYHQINDRMLEDPPKVAEDDEPVRRDEYESTEYDSDEETREDVDMVDEGRGSVVEGEAAQEAAETEEEDEILDFVQPDHAWDSEAADESDESEEPSDFFDTSDEEAATAVTATVQTCASPVEGHSFIMGLS